MIDKKEKFISEKKFYSLKRLGCFREDISYNNYLDKMISKKNPVIREKEIRKDFKKLKKEELLEKALKLQRTVDRQAQILDEWYQKADKRDEKIKELKDKLNYE